MPMIIAIRFKLPIHSDYIDTGETINLVSTLNGTSLLNLYKSPLDGYVYLRSGLITDAYINLGVIDQEITAYISVNTSVANIGAYMYTDNTYAASAEYSTTTTSFGRLSIAQSNNYPINVVNVLETYNDLTHQEIVAII